MPKAAPFPALLERIASRVGTPTFVYFPGTVRDRIEALRGPLTGVPGRLLYAMKANSHPAMLDLMRREGLGIDAVSPAELLLALRLGFEPEAILFSANNMSDAEMQFAHRQGVLLNIGDLSRLERFGTAFPGSRVCVRINPQIGAGHHDHVITAGSRSKFGIPVAEADHVLDAVRRHDLRLVGLHQHIGSGIMDTVTLWRAIEVLLTASRRFAGLDFLNLGGGLGIPYRPEESGLDLQNFEHRIAEPLRAYADETGTDIWFEPGRFLTAESGVLLVRVTNIKANADRVFVGVDSGMNHLVRPALYGSYHEIVNVTNPDGPPATYDVVGNICETGDTFARDRTVSTVHEGDLLAILDTGAYGAAMSSTYNLRPPAAEVWVVDADTGRFDVVTERASAAELVAETLARSRIPRG